MPTLPLCQRARPLPACPNGRKAGQMQAPSKRTRRKYPDSAIGCCCSGKVTRTGGEVLQEALGSGIVAQTLGAGFLDHGYQVMMGTREPAKLADWHKQNSKATIGDFAATARFAEVAV